MKEQKQKSKMATVIATVVLTVVVLFVYRLFLVPNTPIYQYYPFVMWGYMIILTVVVVVYIFYNRAFSRNGVTVDMLPMEWSEEKKNEFVASAERRRNRSRWMLMLIIAFLVTFLVDAIELFVLPIFDGWF